MLLRGRSQYWPEFQTRGLWPSPPLLENVGVLSSIGLATAVLLCFFRFRGCELVTKATAAAGLHSSRSTYTAWEDLGSDNKTGTKTLQWHLSASKNNVEVKTLRSEAGLFTALGAQKRALWDHPTWCLGLCRRKHSLYVPCTGVKQSFSALTWVETPPKDLKVRLWWCQE